MTFKMLFTTFLLITNLYNLQAENITVDNIELFYTVHGANHPSVNGINPRQPTMIVLHGGPGIDHTPYEAFWSQLATDVQIIFVDLRGHGQSSKSSSDKWNLTQWGEDVYLLAKALGLENKVVVAGVSFGGWVAQSCAILHPDFLAGLILTDTEPCQNKAAIIQSIKDAATELHLDPEQAALAANNWFTNPSLSTLMNYFSLVISTCCENHPKRIDDFSKCQFNWDLAHHFQTNEAFQFDFRNSLSKITCPVLQITGDYSPIHSLKAATELAKQIPHIHFEVLKGAGPLCYNHEPDTALQLIMDFLKKEALFTPFQQ